MNVDNPSKVPTFKAMEIPAQSLKVELQLFEARGTSEFDGIFASMVKRRVDVAIVQEETLFTFNARAVADLALKHRLPTIGGSELVDAGGLINYGTNRLEQFRRAGYFALAQRFGIRVPGSLQAGYDKTNFYDMPIIGTYV
jgi:putative ABC transport system substrate-binding protein